jgi:hypothetical protein
MGLKAKKLEKLDVFWSVVSAAANVLNWSFSASSLFLIYKWFVYLLR